MGRASTVLVALLLALALTNCGDGDANVNTEVDAIISDWADAWVEDEPDRVLDLYAADGTYADAAYPFELTGRTRIGQMVRGSLSETDFTRSEATTILYNDEGATAQWIWAGTYEGKAFSMRAQTTFVIDDGLITRSTDSYFRPEAPWTGQRLGGTSPWEVTAEFGDAAWAGDMVAMEALLDPEVVRVFDAPGDEFDDELIGRDAVMEAYEREVGPPSPGGHAPCVSTSAEELVIEEGIVTQFEPDAAYVTEVSGEGLILRLEESRSGALVQGWTRIADAEQWTADVADIEPLPDGGFVAATLDPLGVVWSPDGSSWIDGGLDALLTPGVPTAPLAEHSRFGSGILTTTRDQVAILDSVNTRVWIGQPDAGNWEPIDLDTTGLRHVPVLVAVASNDTDVLVVGEITEPTTGDDTDEGRGPVSDVYLAWVVTPADSTVERHPIPLDLDVAPTTSEAALEWFEDNWLLVIDGGSGEHLLVSPDGADWSRVGEDDYWDGGFTSWSVGPDSIVATVCMFGGDGFWVSTDGLHWTETTTAYLGHHSTYSDAIGYVVMYKGEGGNSTVVSSDGRSWSSVGRTIGGPRAVAEMSASGRLLLVHSGTGLWLWSGD